MRHAVCWLRERLRFETLLSRLAASVIHIPIADLDKALEQSLGEVIDGLAVDRGAVVEHDGLGPRARIVWTSPGVTAPPPILDATRFPWAAARLREGDVVRLSRMDDLPGAAAVDRASFVAAGTRSHVSLPLRTGGRPHGALSLEAVHAERAWSEDLVESVRLLGEAFAHALERRRREGFVASARAERASRAAR